MLGDMMQVIYEAFLKEMKIFKSVCKAIFIKVNIFKAVYRMGAIQLFI
jgi:hypothetical protein